jgi:hypothetical protein
MPTNKSTSSGKSNPSRHQGASWPVLLLLGALAAPASAAEPAAPAAKPTATKPAAKGETAGIIVLDGKTPPAAAQGTKPAKPTKGADAATGIGLGGCAACDKSPAPGQKKPAAAAAQDKPAAGK